MTVVIILGRVKQSSEVFIDGHAVKRGILDFDVDLKGEFPSVTLKIAPERLRIEGEAGAVIARDLSTREWRSGLRSHVRGAFYALFRSLRLAREDLRGVWREAHPARRDSFYL